MTDQPGEKVIMYGHPACTMVPPVKNVLQQADVPFKYINIHEDADARRRVQELNNGNESVPTLEFPDGTTLTEPPTGVLMGKLRELGYQVGPLQWLTANALNILFALIIVAIIANMIFGR